MTTTIGSRAGKLALVRVQDSATGTPVVVGGVKSFNIVQEGRNVEDTEMSDFFVTRLGNLLDAKVELAGGRRLSDAGQAMILDGLRYGTGVWMLMRPASSLEWQQHMMVTKFTTDVQIDGRAEFSCDLEGTGIVDDRVVPGIALGTQDDDFLTTQADDLLST